jgi:hypothetical protein
MELRSTIKFALIGNLVALAIIYAIESTTQFFGIKYPSDDAFFVLMIFWGSAALLYMFPPGSVAAFKTQPTPDGDNSSDETEQDIEVGKNTLNENSRICIKLLLSGCPGLMICLLNYLM